MPPGSRKLRSRKEADLQPSDADTPDSIATPSRKRRKVNGAVPAAVSEDLARTRITESVASDDSNRTISNGDDVHAPESQVERQNQVIAHLTIPKHYTPNAAIDYANDLQARLNPGTTPAYAKIAAQDWCFFVKKMRLLIGRADSSVRPDPPSTTGGTPNTPPTDEQCEQWGVDIDLGPERQISRVHAEIAFDVDAQTWFITVNSRNGLKLDDTTLARGSRAPLHSGICINIFGTQMLFLLADDEDKFHPMLYRQMKFDPEQEESDTGGNPPYKSLPHAHPPAPTPKREQRDPFPSSTHTRQHGAQGHAHQLTSTPGRGDPGTPLPFRSTEKSGHVKTSPATYPRGMMLDSTEDIDYSLDSSKDIKPPYSYAQLIGQAILSSPEEMLTLANIYKHIMDRYAFFRHSTTGWQNSIRHNLSLSKCFEKVARRTDEPGKGMKWRINADEREDFIKKQLFSARKPANRFDSSGPSSPALKDSTQATERLVDAMGRSDQTMSFGKPELNPPHIKSPPRSATPPLTSYPTANESYTPDRGPRPPQSFKASPRFSEQVTPAKRLFADTNPPGPSSFIQGIEPFGAPRKVEPQDSSPIGDEAKAKPAGLRDTVANSPPPLYSDTSASHFNVPTSARRSAFETPFVTKYAPRLAPPSTAQVPSQYITLSSPAPFWKYFDLPSTPAKANLDLSPIKLMRKSSEGEIEGEGEAVQPSSPPLIYDGDEKKTSSEERDSQDKQDEDDELQDPNSPTRPTSRPASRRAVSTVGDRPPSALTGLGLPGLTGGIARSGSLSTFDEEEEGGFDLAKGFEKIGTFHRNIAQSHMMRAAQTAPRTSVSTNM